ncbi:hypothetical protein HBB16_01160 [Pseudonocardia sp. MCCB 268]|nr:hypothetical protein [Pseudonocardia cytotoxica]
MRLPVRPGPAGSLPWWTRRAVAGRGTGLARTPQAAGVSWTGAAGRDHTVSPRPGDLRPGRAGPAARCRVGRRPGRRAGHRRGSPPASLRNALAVVPSGPGSWVLADLAYPLAGPVAVHRRDQRRPRRAGDGAVPAIPMLEVVQRVVDGVVQRRRRPKQDTCRAVPAGVPGGCGRRTPVRRGRWRTSGMLARSVTGSTVPGDPANLRRGDRAGPRRCAGRPAEHGSGQTVSSSVGQAQAVQGGADLLPA